MGKYKTLGMARHGGMQKDINDAMTGVTVPYLLEKQRAPYLVVMNPWGNLDRNLQLLDTTSAHQRRFIFVMDGDGRIFTEDKALVYHHSAFLAGNEVAAAGHWEVVNGRLRTITNDSGHYMPPHDYTEQVITELTSRGYSCNGITRIYSGPDSARMKVLRKARGVPVQRMSANGIVHSHV